MAEAIQCKKCGKWIYKKAPEEMQEPYDYSLCEACNTELQGDAR